MNAVDLPAPDYVCPACRAEVDRQAESYRCAGCGRTFPILFGIPDFRLGPDLYLSLEEERAKAAKLTRFGETASFDELVSFYYSITDDVPAALQPRFVANVTDAPARAVGPLATLGTDPAAGRLLDLGCGSGGALVAAAPLYAERIGVDIALRWLVIAQKRLRERGVAARLVCADADALPFGTATMTHVLADDLLDNVRSVEGVLGAVARVLVPDGRLWLSAANSRWAGPHPATGVWAAGLLPRRLRAARLRKRHGYDLLRAVRLLSPATVRRLGERAGLRLLRGTARRVPAEQVRDRPLVFRLPAGAYRRAAEWPGSGALLRELGPAFEMVLAKGNRG